MSPGDAFWQRVEAAQERQDQMRAQDRVRRLRAGKTPPRTMEELAEWRVYVDDPAATLRKITHDTHPKRGKVMDTPGPREGERVWWVDGVTYTADPEVIWVLAHKRTTIEDAPDGIPDEYTKRVEEEKRLRAERKTKRGRKSPGNASK